MSANKQLVLEYVKAFNNSDIDGVCKLFAPDAQIWGVMGWGTPEDARPVWKDLMDCLQMQLTVDAIVEEAGSVAVRYTERGQSVKPFRGQGPSNRTYELLAMEWFEIENGLIKRRWGTRDSANQSRQLGFAK